MFVIIDLETTGGIFNKEKIIEINVLIIFICFPFIN